MVTKEEVKELHPDGSLAGRGSVLNIGQSRMRARYWRQDKNGNWVQTQPLPADPTSVNSYFAKGFRAKPPSGDKAIENDGLISCPISGCEFKTESVFGLQSHLRVHRPKLEKI